MAINSAGVAGSGFWLVVIGAVLAAVIVFAVARIIIPRLRARKKEFRQSDVLLMMTDEFESAVIVKNKLKARSLYSRIRHFYEYMPPQEKLLFESKLRELGEKLNKMN